MILICIYPPQERGLSLYEDQEIKNEDNESNTASLRDALSLAVPDEMTSGINSLIRVTQILPKKNISIVEPYEHHVITTILL